MNVGTVHCTLDDRAAMAWVAAKLDETAVALADTAKSYLPEAGDVATAQRIADVAYGNKPLHRPSAKSRYVATGRLKASIKTLRRGKFWRVIGTGVHYARHVEYGTRKWGGRPFLRMAVHMTPVQAIWR